MQLKVFYEALNELTIIKYLSNEDHNSLCLTTS